MSVLLPVRNGARYLERALTSTLRAMPTSAELLVMDDGSSDATPKILASVSDPRLQVFRRNVSGGVATALNALLEEANSSIIARMDADDVCLPWRFSRQLQVLEKTGGVVFGNAIYISASGAPGRPTLRVPTRRSLAGRKLLVRNPYVHPTMIAERSALETVGGYRSVGAEDYDLWLRMAARRTAFSVVAVPVLLYRQHKDQVTAGKEAREDLRKRWFGEEPLVRAWAELADSEYELALTRELDTGTACSIDDLKKSLQLRRRKSKSRSMRC